MTKNQNPESRPPRTRTAHRGPDPDPGSGKSSRAPRVGIPADRQHVSKGWNLGEKSRPFFPKPYGSLSVLPPARSPAKPEATRGLAVIDGCGSFGLPRRSMRQLSHVQAKSAHGGLPKLSAYLHAETLPARSGGSAPASLRTLGPRGRDHVAFPDVVLNRLPRVHERSGTTIRAFLFVA